ncbi:DUF3253 domain-containing protein [Luteimonas sp. S4-F44]|uniref:DUF3253 domain-containing protein n=1 Tax=Luteimonas sp. S4-F44 TaxID=2925842 RepID=UPI001F539EC3|nr:DUF3253 domain-containing protein [Luteimonas sp. S4-F44]UNK42383.1 DUF3253 domain-containing protein [Luteimonas sp. S4-F44]
MPDAEATVLRERMLALLSERAADASICPSEVARALRPGGDWRVLMSGIREVAAALARDGVVLVTQHGAIVDADAPPPGPVRVRRGPRWPTTG